MCNARNLSRDVTHHDISLDGASLTSAVVLPGSPTPRSRDASYVAVAIHRMFYFQRTIHATIRGGCC